MKIPRPTPAAVKFFEEWAPAQPNIAPKKVFGQPAAFVNGNMFFGVFGENVFVRLSEEDRSKAEGISGFRTFEPMPGRPMSEYMVLPKTVRGSRAQSREWVARSLNYASGLPPKKAKRKIG